ncbi:MAG: hypothetical protein Q4F67_14315, partial [Propionibacteriaceae bacterium]|nr:hypothetical protein [Propionibacteriaceae bacterium]
LLLSIGSVVGQGLPQPSRPFVTARPADLGTPERVYRPYHFGMRGDERAGVIYERLALPVPDGFGMVSDVDKVPTVLQAATQTYWTGDPTAELVTLLLVGDVEPALVVPGDAEATAEQVLPALLGRYNQGGGATAGQVRTAAWPGVPGAAKLTASLRYKEPTAGASGDDLLMFVIPWAQADFSGMGVWVAIVPETADPEARRVLLEREPSIRLVG